MSYEAGRAESSISACAGQPPTDDETGDAEQEQDLEATCAALRLENKLLRAEQLELLRECDILHSSRHMPHADLNPVASYRPSSSAAVSLTLNQQLVADVRSILTVLENVLRDKRDAEIRHAAAVAALQDEIDDKASENTKLLLMMDSIVAAMEQLQHERRDSNPS